ncbi:MAG: chemotaxis protein CheW [Deltaproteobacteria bacterium]|nr:chemotaxis protein CheW [Deltaproteobacteria bacterium]
MNRSISSDIVRLQQSLMEVRQVVMDNVLKKFPRLVRDLSREMGKEVELDISGQTVPIDKSLLEDVEQALIHLIRNAIDHGLEGPDEREAGGKERRGCIGISTTQEETSVLIEVSDNGRGIDYAAIRKKALDRGIITADQLAEMSDHDSDRLIFPSGVTTKTEATDISGRGVGLDVVMSNVRKWGGEVGLINRPGQGVTISLRLPITNTLLTKQAIMLKLADQTFCLPMDSILEIVIIPNENIHKHKEQIIFEHRDRIISVVELEKTLGLENGRGKTGDTSTMVILKGENEKQRAIVADEVLGQQKIVVKEFELAAFRGLKLFQGFCLTGDGRAVLVLDADRLLN